MALTLCAAAMGILEPWPLKLLVDYALGQARLPPWFQESLSALGADASPAVLVVLAGLLTLMIFAFNSLLDVALSWSWLATGQRMVYDLAADVLDRLLRLSLSYHARHSVGDYLARLSGDTWCVYKVVADLLVSPFQQLTTLVGMGVVAWLLDPLLTVITFALAPLIAISVWYFGPRLKQRAKLGRQAQSRLAGFVHQTVTAIPLVQAFNATPRNQVRFGILADDVVAISQQGVLLNRTYALVNGLANSAGRAGVIFVGGLQVMQGSLTIGSLLVFLAYVRKLQDACTQLLRIHAELKTSEASLERLLEILDADEAIEELPTARPLETRVTRESAGIELEHVSFGYDRSRPVLQDVSLVINRGEKVALVGPSGAGKSTLAALILRLYDPWQGSILLQGVPLRELTLDSLRAQVAVLLQDPYLLPVSIADNIRMGRSCATRAEIVEAAKAANAHEFIEKLPAGYDSIVGQRGSTLSGGQRQRVAIARAFVRNAPIIILDEPTASLDAGTEAALLEAFHRLMEGRTAITIAHRLSTVRSADRILVMQDGRIVEAGSHDCLMGNGTLYQRLYTAQEHALIQEAKA